MNAQDPRKGTQNQIPISILYEIQKAAQFFLASEEPFQKEYDKRRHTRMCDRVWRRNRVYL